MDVLKGGDSEPKGRNADPTRDGAPPPGAADVSAWLQARQEAIHREKAYRKDAVRITKIYEAAQKDENSYNILYANTDTLSPALYSQPPRPLCKRRFKDADPIGKAVAQTCQRSLEYVADTNDEDYESFDELMKGAVTSALVPGRGVMRWKYDDKTVNGKVYKKICAEMVPWDRYHYGYARTWLDVPWVGFDHFMTKDEVSENFSPAIAARLDFTQEQPDAEEDDSRAKRRSSFAEDGIGKAKLCLIFEVWDKAKREVRFYSPGYEEGALKKVADPLGLTGFFPMTRPLQLVRKITTLTPTPLYIFYEEQAKELNRVTQRINKIVSHMKVRGVYDGRITELEKLFSLNDGEMQPADSMESLDQATRLEQSLWFMPLDKLVAALQQLYLQRAQVKQVIYELTGIADIMRGSSAASETLGAQEIKERWGGVRLKRMQREVAKFARDNLRIAAELVFSHLDEATLKAMTNLPYPTSAEKAKAQQVVAAAQQAQPLPGAPPSPPDPRVAALSKLAEMPSFGDVLTIGKSDQLRGYRIDIETNSTVDLEMTEDKKDVAEMMGAMSQAMQGLTPLVVEGALPVEGAKAILLAMSRRFRFGEEVEEYLMQMGPPKGNGKEAETQAKAQEAQAKLQLEQQKAQQTAQLDREKFQAEMQRQAAELQMAQRKMEAELQMAREKMQADIQLAREKAAADVALAQQKAIADTKLANDKAVREDQRAERDGQRQRALDRKKEEQSDQQTTVKLVKDISGILQNYEKSKQDGAADKQSAAIDATMKALVGVVDKIATLHGQPQGAVSKTITLTKSGDSVKGEIKPSSSG